MSPGVEGLFVYLRSYRSLHECVKAVEAQRTHVTIGSRQQAARLTPHLQSRVLQGEKLRRPRPLNNT